MVRFKVISVSVVGNEKVGGMSGIGSIEGDYMGLVVA